jgi:pantoate--beta-alanine ligase
MRLIKSKREMNAIANALKITGKSIGFVPTMGYFHEGHLSLMRCARRENDVVVVSIFVNPIQFGPKEDFEAYPRDVERDRKLAEREGVDYLFVPDKEEIYPEGFSTFVEVKGITDRLCGKSRPGHFVGVTTVLVKLFNIVNPTKAYFGKKDFQQLKVVEKMVKDLDMGIKIVPCPIVREPDGLAMSSRNVYLSPEERKSALSLYKSLLLAKRLVESGIDDPEKVKEEMRAFILSHPHVKKVDYIEIVDQNSFEQVDKIRKGDLVAVAVFVGNARLIDNWVVGEDL